jgi:hypothetical protein
MYRRLPALLAGLVVAAVPAVYMASSVKPAWAAVEQAADPASSTAPRTREAVIVSDGTTDCAELNTKDNVSGLGCRGLHRGVGARVTSRSGVVTVELWTDQMGPSDNPGAVWLDSSKPQIPLGTYLVPATRSVTVDAGVPYGLPILSLRLATYPNSCLYDPREIEATPSLQLEGASKGTFGGCRLVFRNVSSKRVIAAGLNEVGPHGVTGASTFSAFAPATPVPAGGTFSLAAGPRPKPGQQGDIRGSQFQIMYVLFDDGSYEGDAELAKSARGQ